MHLSDSPAAGMIIQHVFVAARSLGKVGLLHWGVQTCHDLLTGHIRLSLQAVNKKKPQYHQYHQYE